MRINDMKEIIAEWNSRYFDGEMSHACLTEFDPLDTDDRELVNLVDTWMFYYHAAGGNAKNFPPLLSRFFAHVAKSYLPTLWAKIPPITRGGRLRGIDRVVHEVLTIGPNQAIRFLDVGCGYPPLTTVETAAACPGWDCVGIDPNFPAWILFDGEGAAACFDKAGTLTYIQYLDSDLQPALDRVTRDRQKFTLQWGQIQANPALREELVRSERLIRDPMQHYEGPCLAFRSSSLTGLNAQQQEPFDLIRCMNVFMYFDGRSILENIGHAKSLLADSGAFLYGSVPELGSASARYMAYQKRGAALVPWLFGMDLGKFAQVDGTGWWAFHKDQPDTLFASRVVRWVSDSGDLGKRVSAVIDRVRQELGYGQRNPDGYLNVKGVLSNTDNARLNMTLADACGDDIVAFLGARGLCAEITPFGHLVIDLGCTTPELYEQYFPAL